MTVKTVTVKIMCEECDVEEVKEQLRTWYYENNIGMDSISFD